MKKAVFTNNSLSLKTKRLVYRAVVLGVLLYGVETIALIRDHSRKLEVFHNRCLRAILGITINSKTEDGTNNQCTSKEEIWCGRAIRRPNHRQEAALAWTCRTKPVAKTAAIWLVTTTTTCPQYKVEVEG